MNDYNSLLSDQEIAILREKKDWKTTMTIISMWAQVFFAFSLFIYLPNVLTFIISSVTSNLLDLKCPLRRRLRRRRRRA